MVQIKTITTGASEEEVIFDKFNFLKGAKDTIYIWVRNFGDSDIYMSDHPGIVAGNDDVIKLGAKSVGLVTTAVDNKIYILGASTLECHAQFFAECPFRGVGSGGGGGDEPYIYLKNAVIENDGSLTLTKKDDSTVSLVLDSYANGLSKNSITSNAVANIIADYGNNAYSEPGILGWGAFAIGGLTGTTLNPAQTYRVSSTTVCHTTKPVTLIIDDDMQVGLSYCDADGTFISFSNWQSTYYVIPKDKYFKFQIKKNPESASYKATVAEFTSKIHCHSNTFFYANTAELSAQNNLYGTNVINPNDYSFKLGTILAGAYAKTDLRRMSTIEYIDISSAETVSFNIKADYNFGWHFYRAKSEDSLIKEAPTWVTSSATIGIPAGASYLRVNIARKDNTAMNVDVDNDALTIYTSRADRREVGDFSYHGEKMPTKCYRFSAERLLTITGSGTTVQDIEILGDYVFAAYGDDSLKVYSLSTKTLLATLSVAVHHGSSVQFSYEYYNESDDFPLLYSGGWTDNLISVIRITKTGDVWDATVVRTLKIPTTYGYYHSPNIDKVGKILYTYAHTSTPYTTATDYMIIAKFDLTNLTDNGDGTHTPAYIEQIRSPYLGIFQGHKYYNGRLYVCCDTSDNSHKIATLDAGTGELRGLIDVTQIRNTELEGICYQIVNDNIDWYYNDGAYMFKLDFS